MDAPSPYFEMACGEVDALRQTNAENEALIAESVRGAELVNKELAELRLRVAELERDGTRVRTLFESLSGQLQARLETMGKFLDDPTTLLNSDPTELFIDLCRIQRELFDATAQQADAAKAKP